MAQTWPGTLPQYFLKGSYMESPKQQFISSSGDLGRTRRRRRFTAEIKDVNGTMRMTRAQITILEEFYYNTCLGGTDSFEIIDPFSMITNEYNFVKFPSYRHIGGDLFDVVFTLERIQ